MDLSQHAVSCAGSGVGLSTFFICGENVERKQHQLQQGFYMKCPHRRPPGWRSGLGSRADDVSGTPCCRATAATMRHDERPSLESGRSGETTARHDSDITVQNAPGTGPRPLPEADSKPLERPKACAPPWVLTVGDTDGL